MARRKNDRAIVVYVAVMTVLQFAVGFYALYAMSKFTAMIDSAIEMMERDSRHYGITYSAQRYPGSRAIKAEVRHKGVTDV